MKESFADDILGENNTKFLQLQLVPTAFDNILCHTKCSMEIEEHTQIAVKTKITFNSNINWVPRNSGEAVWVNPTTTTMIQQMRHRFTRQVSWWQSRNSSLPDKPQSMDVV